MPVLPSVEGMPPSVVASSKPPSPVLPASLGVKPLFAPSLRDPHASAATPRAATARAATIPRSLSMTQA